MAASLRLRELTRLFGASRAVDRLTLAIEPGSIVALLGPSGCGKTTTLRMIAGLVEPSAGQIFLNDQPIAHTPVHRRNIGMLFQNYALFPHMTVTENVSFGLETRGMKRRAAAIRAAEALELVQLSGYGERMPVQLSGGQQQRVALARALVVEPALLLLDEPLGALDRGLRQNMQIELRDLQRRLGITTIMVTHDQDEALTMADRVVIMRAGRLEQSGSPSEVYQRPVSRFVASFLGGANFFRGRIERSDPGSSVVAVRDGPAMTVLAARPVGAEVTVALRPEAVTVTSSPAAVADESVNTIPAVIEKIVYLGFVTHLHLRLPNGDPLLAFQQNQVTSGQTSVDPGASVWASWPAASSHFVRDDLD
jgi:putative spermidine/putrescine transport system ATP-binding protein/spermidine/putrescine transport system ATP-binding protein